MLERVADGLQSVVVGAVLAVGGFIGAMGLTAIPR